MKGDGKRPEFEVININTAFKDFEKKDKEIDKILYKAIIKKFFLVYINELLFLNQTMYFPITGKAKLNKCGNWIKRDKSTVKAFLEDKLKKATSSLGIYWFHRPFPQWYYYRLKKMTGTTNLFPKLEASWKLSFDIDMLERAADLKKQDQFRIVKPKKI